jgi:ribosomal protein S18 acetylase RimI-like enzyme
MPIRPFRREDAPAVIAIAAGGARSEADFVLNPLWETEAELWAEFERFGISPEEHLWVADPGDGEVLGLAGFLRRAGAREAGMFCPIVKRGERGQGLGGELLRGVQRLGSEQLGIRVMTAGIGTRNRAGYSLLTSHGFRPTRQAFLMLCTARPPVEPPPVEDLVLEDASPDDADEILALYTACGFEERSPERMREALDDGHHAHAVARHAGRIVAFVELETHWPKRPWVAFVGVEKELRDRGVGSNLVSWSLARRFDAGARAGQLMLSPANRGALRAYEKVGFRRHRLVDVLEKSFRV